MSLFLKESESAAEESSTSEGDAMIDKVAPQAVEEGMSELFLVEYIMHRSAFYSIFAVIVTRQSDYSFKLVPLLFLSTANFEITSVFVSLFLSDLNQTLNHSNLPCCLPLLPLMPFSIISAYSLMLGIRRPPPCYL